MGFYSDPSIFDGAHAAVRQTEASKEAGTDAQMGSAVGKTGNRRPDGKRRGENWVGGWCSRGAKMLQMGAQRPSDC